MILVLTKTLILTLLSYNAYFSWFYGPISQNLWLYEMQTQNILAEFYGGCLDWECLSRELGEVALMRSSLDIMRRIRSDDIG